jgi:hypothetical protein
MNFQDIPDTEYHASEGLSSSLLKLLLRSPAHYIQHENKDTAALRFGRALHACVLEFDKFQKHKRIQPDVDRRTKQGKEDYADFVESCTADSIMLTTDDHADILAMNSAIRAATNISGDLEKSGTYHHEGFNVDLRIRPDIMQPDIGLIRDVKSCEDAREGAFRHAVRKYNYDLSAAFYIDVANKILKEKVFTRFQWIAVEKSKPFGVMIYDADESLLEQGRAKYMQALTTYAECVNTGHFPAYPNEPVVLYGD